MGTRRLIRLVQIYLAWTASPLDVAFLARCVYHAKEKLLLSRHLHYRKARHRYRS
jgi:hypothetical protein